MKVGDVVMSGGGVGQIKSFHAVGKNKVWLKDKNGDLFQRDYSDLTLATPDEIDEFYTGDLPGGVRVRAFKWNDGYGDIIRLLFSDEEYADLLPEDGTALCAALNLLICDGEPKYPKAKDGI